MAIGFIGVESSGAVTLSMDGTNWFGLKLSQFSSTFFTGVATTTWWALACGAAPGTPIIARTVDGFTWTYPTLPAGLNLGFITFLGIATTLDYSICIGTDITAGIVVLRSTDQGNAWTQITGLPDAVAPTSSQPVNVFIDNNRVIFPALDANTFGQVILESTDQGLTWTTHAAAGVAGNILLYGVSGNSTQYFAVGGDFTASEVGAIQTSPTTAAWTSQSPSGGVGEFDAVNATGSITVAVGTDPTFFQGVIQTSTDGITWTPQPVPAISSTDNVAQFFCIAKNDNLWAAGGADTFNGAAVIATSPDGMTWTITQAGQTNSPIYGIAAFDPIPPPLIGSYTVLLYDVCCHLYTSQDQGAVWIENHQSTDTLGDDWSDLAIAQNDGNYQTMLSFDDNYDQNNPGRASISNNFGFTGSWTIINPDPTGNVSVINYRKWNSGCISTAGNVIILTTTAGKTANVSLSYPMYRSTDGGTTYSTVASNRSWLNACCSANGTIMYATSNGSKIAKSIDSGTTWADLAGSPSIGVLGSTPPISSDRIRCTPDGTTVVRASSSAGVNCRIYVSPDSGTTWNNVLTFPAAGFNIDVGVSDDGKVMIATHVNPGEVYISTNSGSSWAQAVGINATGLPFVCNVSPDGQAFVVGYGDHSADISFDQGATWTNVLPGSIFDFVTAFVVPSTQIFPNPQPRPPTPTPTPTPETCVIADTDTFDYIFAFSDYGAFLRDTIVGPYARQTKDILVYNPVETVLHLPFFYPRTTPTVPIPPTVPPNVPDVITPPVPVVGNPTVDLPQLADSSLYLPTFWALITVPGPVVAALWNHPNLVLVNDLTLMRASQCSVVKTRIDVSHINIMISNYGPVYVYDGLCVSPCAIQTMQ